MKKLMIIAAAATLAVGAEGLTVRHCKGRSQNCPVVAFKVTANGKIATEVESKKGNYKTAAKLQIKKGALVIFATQGDATNPDSCCYEAYSLYLKARVNKTDYPFGVFYQPLESWSIFGKKFNQIEDSAKSKKAKVESEIGLAYGVTSGLYGNGMASTDAAGIAALANNAGDTLTNPALVSQISEDCDITLSDFAFIATAFGKGTYAYSYYESSAHCAVCTEESESFTPGSYSGWFAGVLDNNGDAQGCLMCDCYSLDVFGGTWKAKYESKWSRDAEGWQKAVANVFGSAALYEMKYGPDYKGMSAEDKSEIEKTGEWYIE